MNNKNIINVEPPKELFVIGLTKDISSYTAILELIDNSIHSAQKLRKKGDFTGLYVKIKINYKNILFNIEANCGGISIEAARSTAFRLGNDFMSNKSGFGIGMKRSLFRLASTFEIDSIHNGDCFKLNINVDDWLKNSGWDVPIEILNLDKYKISGVIIKILKPTKEFKRDIYSKKFKDNLIKAMKYKYEIFIRDGFKIYVNDEKIELDNEEYVYLANKKYKITGLEIKIELRKCSINSSFSGTWNYIVNNEIIEQSRISKEDGYDFGELVGYVYICSKDICKLFIRTDKSKLDHTSYEYLKIEEFKRQIVNNNKSNFKRNVKSNICYQKSIEEIKQLKKKLNLDNESNAELGRKTFEICLDSKIQS